MKLKIERDQNGFERIVFGEVLIPDTPNSYGDFHTRESIREFAYGFALNGFGIDVEHDNDDIAGEGAHIVESFIAREGDPDFVPGAWVVGMHIPDDAVWRSILDGEINGYSYEAMVNFFPMDLEVLDERTRYGTTQPDPMDGHTHKYFVLLDRDDRVITGGTTEAGGHRHTISRYTFTEKAFDHSHIINLIQGKGGT